MIAPLETNEREQSIVHYYKIALKEDGRVSCEHVQTNIAGILDPDFQLQPFLLPLSLSKALERVRM